MTTPACRPALVGDAAEIHALLLAAAGDIPLAVESLEQEEALYAALRRLLAFGESWVAEDGGRVVGAIVVENVQTGRHWGESEVLDLRYAVVEPACRDGAVLEALVAKALERKAPLGATVKAANRLGLAECLERLGFSAADARIGETRYRWAP